MYVLFKYNDNAIPIIQRLEKIWKHFAKRMLEKNVFVKCVDVSCVFCCCCYVYDVKNDVYEALF